MGVSINMGPRYTPRCIQFLNWPEQGFQIVEPPSPVCASRPTPSEARPVLSSRMFGKRSLLAGFGCFLGSEGGGLPPTSCHDAVDRGNLEPPYSRCHAARSILEARRSARSTPSTVGVFRFGDIGALVWRVFAHGADGRYDIHGSTWRC